jgi:hypothetical protein
LGNFFPCLSHIFDFSKAKKEPVLFVAKRGFNNTTEQLNPYWAAILEAQCFKNYLNKSNLPVPSVYLMQYLLSPYEISVHFPDRAIPFLRYDNSNNRFLSSNSSMA